MRRSSLLAALAAAGALAVTAAGPATAAVPTPGTAAVAGRTLVYMAGTQVANNVSIIERVFIVGGFRQLFYVVDDSFRLNPGAGCARFDADLTKVRCRGATGIAAISVNARDGNDRVSAPVGVPATMRGGAGADVLTGGRARDVLIGERDADTLQGGLGDDVLSGGAGRDTLNGGPGTDRADGGAGFDRCFAEVRVSCER
ncbi:hypothetical protein MF672_021360 [Actinomadura sp. ATCC 31491]|uniref:Calcium-binding protein n=1 Tax=Actinomadura luzonensis TaxID=2805427 RepID=A0ABT0FVQ6_9ACTN|nr:hypothetical protein [Actinomadura luzonensis]MCK2216329.1 hypothetical protein [Actinomadura luzonensis]